MYIRISDLKYEIVEQYVTIENIKYVSYGLVARMIDNNQEVVEVIQDITSKLETAQLLLQQVKNFRVSPLCLKMFVENFLLSLR